MTTQTQRQAANRLWQDWAALWNGELERAASLIAEGFTAHLTGDAAVPPQPICDAASVAQWVAFIRARRSRLSYATLLGPIVDGELLVGHWHAEGLAVPAEGGAPQPFVRVGTDILRFRDGRLVECWTMNNRAA
jgi:hypothetical protein